MRPELHDRGDDLGRDLREFGDENRGERLLHLRLVFTEAAGAADLGSKQVLIALRSRLICVDLGPSRDPTLTPGHISCEIDSSCDLYTSLHAK